MVIAQAVIERGVLDSGASGVSRLFNELSYYGSQGSTPWLILGALLVLAWIFLRSRR